MPPRTRTAYRWDDAAGRYRNARGRFVPRAEVRREIERGLAAVRGRAAALAEQLQRRAITLDEWVAGMRDVVRHTHLGHAAAAKGGWAQMTPADWGRVGRRVRDEFAFLERMADQIEAGLPLDGRLRLRAEMYANAGRQTFHRTERIEMQSRGYDEERNVLHPADHCGGCLDETARGWVGIGELRPIGTRDCRANDVCSIEYRNSETGAVFG